MATSPYQVRADRVDHGGKVALRHDSKLFHIAVIVSHHFSTSSRTETNELG